MFNLVTTTFQTLTGPLGLSAEDGFDPDVEGIMNSPWNDFFQEMGGRLIGTGCIVGVIFAAVFLFMWLGGRFCGNAMDQTGRLSNRLWLVRGAVLFACVGGTIA